MNDINDMNGQVIVVKYRKVEDVVPGDGVSKLYHVVVEEYYNWDGEKWIKEE